MKQEDLKFVKGSLERGKPATVCFFDDVDYWSVQDFIAEFNWIKDCIGPSEIRVLINSVGGNCVDGVSAFATIINCEIPTVCIIEGIAASMGSIIWAAGNKCYMRDYALLMIHNPWSEKSDDPNMQRTIDNFTTQLKTIYMKRFNMDEDKIKAIMDGEENYDGTYFTAQQAVNAGFITADQIIHTPGVDKNIAASLKNKLDGVKNNAAIVSLMQDMIDKNLKNTDRQSIMAKEDNISNNKKENNMNQEFTVVAALLGLTGEKANEEAVSAKVKDLMKATAELDSVKAENKTLSDKVNALNTELAGSKASVENYKKELDDAKASIDAYKQKEEDARNAEINAMVEDAVKVGKIAEDTKGDWVEMAQNNLELAKKTLDSIPARDNIQAEIAKDPANQDAAQKGMTEAEKEIQAKIAEVVGKDFKFHKTDEL